MSRWAAVLAVTGAIAAITASAALATPSASSAAKSCAGNHSLSADLNATDYGLLHRYVPCVLLDLLGSQQTATTTHTTLISSRWNRVLAKVITGFVNDPRQDYSSTFINDKLKTAARSFLPQQFKRCGEFWMQEGDTAPPPITLADVATATQRIVAIIPPTTKYQTVGFYVGHRPVFHDGPADNISWAVSGIFCRTQ
jgi:hypothetical protein